MLTWSRSALRSLCQSRDGCPSYETPDRCLRDVAVLLCMACASADGIFLGGPGFRGQAKRHRGLLHIHDPLWCLAYHLHNR